MPYVDEIRVFFGDEDAQDRKQQGETQSELHNSLLTLLSQTKKPAPKKKEQEPEDPYYFGEYEEKPKKKKKEKEKKKKKKDKGSLLDDLEVDVIYGGDFLKDKYVESVKNIEEVDDNPNQIDIDKVFEDDEYDDEMDTIIYDQKNSYKKNKKSDNEFRKEFAEELALLYSLLDETNAFGTDLDKIYKAMTTSKTRGFSKYTTDLIASILSTKQTKLSVLKEIASVKKTVADLAMKEAKNSTSKDEGNDVSALAANYLSSIVKYGRQDVVKALTGSDSYYNTGDDAIDEFVNNVGDYEDDDERDNLNQELLEGLEENSFVRSAQSDAYIRNEAREVNIQIRHDISSGRWDFMAVDKNGNMVMDYPLPDKGSVTPVKFTADGSFGTDKFGRSYKVVEIC